MEIIVWFIVSYGLMNIMVYSSIFQGLRNSVKEWGESNHPYNFIGEFISGILTCPMCFSFHGGWFLSLVLFSPIHELFQIPTWYSWFFDAILSSGAVWGINSIIEWFEENRPSK